MKRPTVVQHELFPFDTGVSRELLCDLLNEGMPRPVNLAVTTNRVSMASVDFAKVDAIRVRLHEEFLKAPEEVLQALRRYLQSHEKAQWQIVAEFARSIVAGKHHPARRKRLPMAGKVYDLKELRDDINGTYFGGRITCRIQWGRHPTHRRRSARSRSIRYGSWDSDDRTIRVNPLLDDVRVPYEFMRYIVFHEMLHAVVPAEHRDGRRYYHATTFKRLERTFPNLEGMRKLSKDLVSVLIA